MNFIQSLWINPNEESPKTYDGGWISPTFNYLSWILSASLIHEKYGQVSLFCNSYGKYVLIDILDLPYSNVDTSMDFAKFGNSNIWVFKKLYVYSIQKNPFIHLDGDVFIFDYLPDSIKNGSISVQNFEKEFLSYRDTDKLFRSTINLPLEFDGNQECTAINAGILGGNDINQFSEFYNIITNLYNSNSKKIDELYHKNGDLNRYLEQLLLFNFLSNKKVTINPVIVNNIYNSSYIGFARLERYPDLKYAHLMNRFKYDISLCYKLAAIAHNNYPDKFSKLREYIGVDFDSSLEKIGFKF